MKTYNSTPHTRRAELNSVVLEMVSEHNISCIYVRYHLSDPGFIFTLRKIKRIRPNITIAIEIPTFPYEGEFSTSVRDFIRKTSDHICRSFLRKYVDRIVTYSADNEIFGISTIKTINGVMTKDIIPVEHHEKDNINLISVSVTSSVHGYDRVITGLRDYYSTYPKRRVMYHIVGNGDEIENYRKMVKEYGLENEVIIYGFLSGEDLDNVYKVADIAVNSLGIHRRKLKTESTLKTKEYAAKGLPMISSYPIDVLEGEEGSKYQMVFSADDTPISINKIIEFYDSLYGSTGDITQRIRSLAVERCDMSVTQSPIVEFFLKQVR